MPGTTTALTRSQDLRPMYVGLTLTILLTLAPAVDVLTVDSIADHVRGAYPDWSADLVAADRNAIAMYLAGTGVLGVVGWLWAIRGAKRRKKWSRAVTTTLFVAGASTALFNLSYSADPYSTIIPAPYGVLGLLPVLAGLIAVIRSWRHGAARSTDAEHSVAGRG